MPKFDWLNVTVWGGFAAYVLTFWALAIIGAAVLLGMPL